MTNVPQDVQDIKHHGEVEREGRAELIAWVNGHVDAWEEARDKKMSRAWDRIERKFNCDDEIRQTATKGFKRSRLVSPALQQAVEDGAADCEEVVFGKEGWFDVTDNIDGDPTDFQAARLMLLDDMDEANVNSALLECFFFGSLYGTMIGKVHIEEQTDFQLSRDVEGRAQAEDEQFLQLSLEPINPRNFIIDTAVNRPGKAGIQMAMGMAHRLEQPKHKILALQNNEVKDEATGKVLVDATYWDTPLEQSTDTTTSAHCDTNDDLAKETVMFTEYHGLVPRKLLDAAIADSDVRIDEIDTADMVEAVVTYVNEEFALGARPNRNLKGMRAIVAGPWDVVPGQFWGRGIGEKALPAQITLDIFLRGQVDAMRYHVYPIMAVNGLRISPRTQIVWGPGNEIRTNGDPSDSFFPIQMPAAGAGTFALTGQLAQHIAQATGVTPDAGRGEQTLGGTSAIRGAFIKRMNRTIRLMSANFLSPFVEIYYLEQMRVNPEQYPATDITFDVRTAAGLLAREQEIRSIVEMLQFIPPDSPPFWLLVDQAAENMASKDKAKFKQAIQFMLERTQQPPQKSEREELEEDEISARTTLKSAQTAKLVSETVGQQREDNREDRAAIETDLGTGGGGSNTTSSSD